MFQNIKFISTLLLGVISGVGLSILVLTLGDAFISRYVIYGAVTGIGLFVLFILLRVALVGIANKEISQFDKKDNSTLDALFKWCLSSANVEINQAQLESLKTRAFAVVNSLTTAWGAFLAMSAGIALAGTLVAMIAALAAIRQVDRIEQQNKLIEQQIFEATAARVSAVYAAQLPTLLDSIKKEREQAEDISDWIASKELVALIQSLINTTEPYLNDAKVNSMLEIVNKEIENIKNVNKIEYYNQKKSASIRKYSPERGQLLQLLISLDFPFGKLVTPLDFSGSDLRNVTLAPKDKGPGKLLDVGETIFADSNFIGADLANVDFSKSNLIRSILPSSTTYKTTKFLASPRELMQEPNIYRHLLGATLSNTIIVNRGEGPIVERPKWWRVGYTRIPTSVLWSPRSYPPNNPNAPEFFRLSEDSSVRDAADAIAEFAASYPGWVLEKSDCEGEESWSIKYLRDFAASLEGQLELSDGSESEGQVILEDSARVRDSRLSYVKDTLMSIGEDFYECIFELGKNNEREAVRNYFRSSDGLTRQ